jgi:hypothetical protein
MRIAARCTAVALLIFSFLPLAHAQRGGMFHPPSFQGVWNPVVGSGGSYEMDDKTGGKTQLDLFIVSKDTVDAKDAYWMETAIQSGKTPGGIVMKIQMVVDAGNSHTAKVIMQMGSQPPMEMPMQMAQQQGTKALDVRSTAKHLGTESITTPAGTFDCEHIQTEDGTDLWVSPKVPPYGLVKMIGKDGNTMILTKVITNGKDRITGTPVPFNPMNMAPPNHQQ